MTSFTYTQIKEFKSKLKNDYQNLINNEVNHKSLFVFFYSGASEDVIRNFLAKTKTQRYNVLKKLGENIMKLINHIYENKFYSKYLESYLKLSEGRKNKEEIRNLIIQKYYNDFEKSLAQSEEIYRHEQIITQKILEIENY